MKKAALFTVTLFLMGLFMSAGSVTYAALNSNPIIGPAPTINGTVGWNEWQGAYQLYLDGTTYQIETYVYFLNDNQNLYVLVDAIDDQTQNDSDECLLVFGIPPDYHAIEIWGGDTTPLEQKFSNGASGSSAKGFGTSPNGPVTPHRIYEFQINLASIGLQPGGSIEFYSPQSLKSGSIHYASMPYDYATGRDNVYPVGLSTTTDSGNPVVLSSVNGYDTLTTSSYASIPTLSQWGTIIFSVLLVLSGLMRGRRRQRTTK
jgi:hypothetical protein